MFAACSSQGNEKRFLARASSKTNSKTFLELQCFWNSSSIDAILMILRSKPTDSSCGERCPGKVVLTTAMEINSSADTVEVMQLSVLRC